MLLTCSSCLLWHGLSCMPLLQGWDEGVAQMSKGERANLKITSDYAYGSQGVGGVGSICMYILCCSICS